MHFVNKNSLHIPLFRVYFLNWINHIVNVYDLSSEILLSFQYIVIFISYRGHLT